MAEKLRYRAVCLNVAKLLRTERGRQNLSLSAVAERAGISYQMVSYVERGMRIPGLDVLLRITAALEIDPSVALRDAISAVKGQD